jgi:hypothetical protein
MMWLRRNWYLLFYREDCIKLVFEKEYPFGYILLTFGGIRVMSIGKGWFKRICVRY